MSVYRSPSRFVIEEFTLTKDLNVLKSTTDLAGKSGAKQIFSVEIEAASTVKTVTAP